MILKQYYLACLAHASYMLADEATKTAVIVDPQRDIQQYIDDAEAGGFAIKHVFLTHFHADFLAGHIELQQRCGAKIHLGAKAKADYAFEAMKEGDELVLGRLKIKVLETPGHTPEGISLVIEDLDAEQNPYAVLTGDTLFIGDVGRPDLMASIGITAEELAGQLYDSLHHKLLPLPDHTLIYPAHGAGSMCGKNLSSETFSTMGTQRADNYALQAMNREDFVAMATSELPQAPQYFAYDAMLNRQNRGTLDEQLEALEPLSFEKAQQLRQQEDAQILDTRSAADFAQGHWQGALNIGLDGSFATWAGTLLDLERPIILVSDEGQERDSAMRLGRIGFDKVLGYLKDLTQGLKAHPELEATITRLSSSALAAKAESDEEFCLLDVRTPTEWNTMRVEGSLNLPLNALKTRLSELPKDQTIVTMCRTGYRSSAAASLLLAAGFTAVNDQVGGILDWAESGQACSPRDANAESCQGT